MSRSYRRPFRTSLAGLLAACALAGAVSGCSPMVDSRGNLPSAERLSRIEPGRTTRDDVAAILGTPSTISPFGDETWYYVSSRTETLAFFAPEEVERKVVAISFDPAGQVKAVRSYGLEDGKPVDLVERETPTAGNELNLIQQLLGNVGRFSGSQGTGPSLPGP